VVGQVVEGYFPAHPDRDLFVSLEPDACYLVLTPTREDARPEQRTPIPQAQAEALLALCAGQVTFACTILRLRGGREALLQRFITPEPLDLLSLEFADQVDAHAFIAPAWLGPEVTQDPAYDRASLARVGLPAPEELPLSNAALHELLDTLEEASIAAQLRRQIAPRASQSRSANEASQAVLPTTDQVSDMPIDPAHREALMAGLAEALQTFAPAQPPAAAGPTSVRRPQVPLATHRYG
jgi:CYTH domain-containing protein